MNKGMDLPIIPLGKPKEEETSPKDKSAESVAVLMLEKYGEAFSELAK